MGLHIIYVKFIVSFLYIYHDLHDLMRHLLCFSVQSMKAKEEKSSGLKARIMGYRTSNFQTFMVSNCKVILAHCLVSVIVVQVLSHKHFIADSSHTIAEEDIGAADDEDEDSDSNNNVPKGINRLSFK